MWSFTQAKKIKISDFLKNQKFLSETSNISHINKEEIDFEGLDEDGETYNFENLSKIYWIFI